MVNDLRGGFTVLDRTIKGGRILYEDDEGEKVIGLSPLERILAPDDKRIPTQSNDTDTEAAAEAGERHRKLESAQGLQDHAEAGEA